MPEQIEEFSRTRIEQMLGMLPAMEMRVDEIDAVSGGVLERENSQTAYEPIQLQVQHLLVCAIEPLSTCSRLMQGEGLPLMSLYPLIRASIEASAFAVWLLAPGTIAKRVFRSLHLTKTRREDADAATASFVPIDPVQTKRFLDRLEELKSMNKALQQSSLDRDFPSTTDVIIDAARHITTGERDILSAWRICSGLAHSNKTMAHRVLQRRQLTEWSKGTATFYQTSSFTVVEGLMRPAFDALQQALAKYEERAAQS
ncbi:hypothetical protein J7E68_15185 [Microbacterium sp. ISL-103]|uniref:hypothetical protein n=1 Tax=Microbacterium sp. ISL-103 TaxID=2819156 RepID=UPI001BEC29C8|nr:hypothetical protein [Microbacterium sp. ISL-103]MBT2475881.1 hypothetical protein [Microbacterium sp. ISL-103]